MSLGDYLDSAIAQLEGERARIDSAITTLRSLKQDWPSNGDGTVARRVKAAKRKPTDRPTDRATRVPGKRGPKPRSLPDGPVSNDDGVLVALSKHGGSLSPGALSEAVGRSEPTVRHAVKLLAKAGKVLLTYGNGGKRVKAVSLPGKSPKEAP